MAGPLAGIRIIEIAGLGPGPFAGMMLADHGAEVIRVDRPGTRPNPFDVLARSRRSVLLDLKSADGAEALKALVAGADGLIEGFRPGVMERLGLGPEVLLGVNPKLIYGRMTGWGQDGPLAPLAGHDIDYIAISGTLGAIGRADAPPTVPLNLVGDFGGGGMLLAFAMVSALLAVRGGAPGQVIDCAMTDGSALLTAMIHGFAGAGMWGRGRGGNMLDSGAPFYDCYETADGGHMAVGAIEPQFYAELREKLGITGEELFDAQMDVRRWPEQKARLGEIFAGRSRAEWEAVFTGSDACVAPVLSFDEAAAHPHNAARGTFVEVGGIRQPAPAPRYSATPCDAPRAPATPGADQELVG